MQKEKKIHACMHAFKRMNELMHACMQKNEWMHSCIQKNECMHICKRMNEWMKACMQTNDWISVGEKWLEERMQKYERMTGRTKERMKVRMTEERRKEIEERNIEGKKEMKDCQ